jgi:hypothetical protein
LGVCKASWNSTSGKDHNPAGGLVVFHGSMRFMDLIEPEYRADLDG